MGGTDRRNGRGGRKTPVASGRKTPAGKDDRGSNLRFFPGVGPIDELVPVGSAAMKTSPAEGSSSDASPSDASPAEGSGVASVDTRVGPDNVRPFPGVVFPGVGPVDELVPVGAAPVGSSVKAPDAATMSADAFWGEYSQSLHQAIEAPALGARRPLPAPTPRIRLERPGARPRPGIGRWLVPAALTLLCVLAAAFTLREVGLWDAAPGAPTPTPAGTSGAGERPPAARARSFPPTRVPPVPARTFPPTRVPSVHKQSARAQGHHSDSAAPAAVQTTPASTPEQSAPATSAPQQSAPPAPEQSAPAAPAAPAPAPSSTPSSPASSTDDSGAGATASRQAESSTGAADIGAGSGLPGPGGPPPP